MTFNTGDICLLGFGLLVLTLIVVSRLVERGYGTRLIVWAASHAASRGDMTAASDFITQGFSLGLVRLADMPGIHKRCGIADPEPGPAPEETAQP